MSVVILPCTDNSTNFKSVSALNTQDKGVHSPNPQNEMINSSGFAPKLTAGFLDARFNFIQQYFIRHHSYPTLKISVSTHYLLNVHLSDP